MTDKISRAFSKINPGHFMKGSLHFFEHQPGPETFEQFTNRHIYATRYAFVAAKGVIDPIAALSDGRTERLFDPMDDDETLVEMFARLKKLAQRTGSSRFFFSRVIPAMPLEMMEGLNPDEDDPRWVDNLIWFSQDSTSGDIRQGGMDVEDFNRLGDIKDVHLGGQMGEELLAVLN